MADNASNNTDNLDSNNTSNIKVDDVEFLRHLSTVKISEAETNELFIRYAQDPSKLYPPELTRLLHDILSANDMPLVVPSEALTLVRNEFALNMQEDVFVSIEEFKTFFLYFHAKPITVLLETVGQAFPCDLVQLPQLAAVVTLTTAKTEQTKTDFEALKEELIAKIAPFEVNAVFVFSCERLAVVDLLVVFKTEQTLLDFLSKGTYFDFDSEKVTSIVNFKTQKLPRLRNADYTKVAQIAAKGYLTVQEAAAKAKELAARHHIDENLAKATESISGIVQDIDRKTHISAIAHDVTSFASKKAEEVDSKLGIKIGLEKMRSDVFEKMEELKKNDTVKSGIDYLNSFWEKGKKVLDDIDRDTKEIIEIEKIKKKE